MQPLTTATNTPALPAGHGTIEIIVDHGGIVQHLMVPQALTPAMAAKSVGRGKSC